jgi:hypothetical protein
VMCELGTGKHELVSMTVLLSHAQYRCESIAKVEIWTSIFWGIFNSSALIIKIIPLFECRLCVYVCAPR